MNNALHIRLLNRNITIDIVAAMIFLMFLTIVVTVKLTHVEQEALEKNFNKQLVLSMKHILKQYEEEYTYRMMKLAQDGIFSNLLKLQDRAALYAFLQPKWELMRRKEPSLEVMQVHLKDGTSFLRMHVPEQYGDYLEDVRPMLHEVHTKHKLLTGYETGRYAIVYRVIAPIFDDNENYLGAIEVGINPNFLVESIREISNYEGTVFIKESDLELYNLSNACSVDGYRMQSLSIANIDTECKVLQGINVLQNQTELSIGGLKYRTHLFGIDDYNNVTKAKILFLQNITNETYLQRYWLLLLFCALALLGTLTLIVFRRIKNYQNRVIEIYKIQMQEMQKIQEQFDLFMKNIPAKIAIKAPDDRIVYMNDKAAAFFARKTLVGLKASDLLPHKEAEMIASLNQKAREQGYAEGIYELHDQNGNIVIHRVLTFAMKHEKETELFIGSIYIDITKEYKAQHEILKLTQILEKSPVSIVITDSEGVIEYVNPWFTKVTGYSADEAIGQNPRILKSDFYGEEVYLKLWNEITHDHVWSGTFKNIKKNGDAYWEKAIIAPILSDEGIIINYMGIKQEITKEIELEAELQERESETKELGHILEETVNEIYIFDQEHLNFVYANNSALKNLGYSLDELSLMTPFDIKPSLDADEFHCHLNALKHSDVKEIVFLTFHRRKDGSEYPGEVYLQQTHYHGLSAYMAIILDVSERERAHKKILDQEDVMIAQSRHAAMGEMIGMIAHQWRQPLSVISMGANNMLVDIELEEMEAEKVKQYSYGILRQTEYLSKTIDDFRNFFRPDKALEEVKLEDILDEAQKIIGKTLEHSNIALHITCNQSYRVKTYSRELLQVYINLLKNAKEALVEHTSSQRRINVTLFDDEMFIFTKICDNGGGIDATILSRIFEPYFSTKDEKTGTGLGLYMSKTIIEKHLHGTIEVQNTDDGVCFIVAIAKNRQSKEEKVDS